MSQGKRKPLFKLQLLSHKCLLLWQCCGSFSHSITVHRNTAESENRWEGRSERGGNCKDKRSYEKNRLTETHKDRVGRNVVQTRVEINYTKGKDRYRGMKKKSKGRIKKEEELQTDMQTDTSKKERGDSSHGCLLFSVISRNLGLCVSPGQPTVGIYSLVGLPANKTHVDLQRNEEGQGPENSLALYPSTHMHAQERPLFISACTVPADANTNTFMRYERVGRIYVGLL